MSKQTVYAFPDKKAREAAQKKSRQTALLINMIDILSEAYNLELFETADAVCALIDCLNKEINSEKQNDEKFDEIFKFIRTVIGSEPEILKEFLEYEDIGVM